MKAAGQETDCGKPTGRDCAEGTEAVDPFAAPLYHYGMLLGVEDMDAALAYPRGKMRLHSSWLHREGVVWGFGVGFDRPGRPVCPEPKAAGGKPAEAKRPEDKRGATYELKVCPGLALDGAGRELHLDVPVCLDLGRWLEEEIRERTPDETKERRRRRLNKEDFRFGDEVDNGLARVTARVMVGYRCCLARPVPAMVGSCEGAERDTAYSRAQETVELWLEPVPKGRTRLPYRRLRVLFGIASRREERRFPRVARRRDRIRRLPADEQPPAYLRAFRKYAARDGVRLHPAGEPGEPIALWPEPDATAIPLATIDCVELRRDKDGHWHVDPASIHDKTVDVTVRPSHVATRTTQELLAGPIAPIGGPLGADAGGPRLIPETLKRHERSITFSTHKELDPASVDEEAFSVTQYTHEGGWASYDIKEASVDRKDHRAVTITFREMPGPIGQLRLIVRGTGPKPLLGEKGHIPFAGKVGDEIERPGTKQDGVDFVHFI
jgi:hypothetical protein